LATEYGGPLIITGVLKISARSGHRLGHRSGHSCLERRGGRSRLDLAVVSVGTPTIEMTIAAAARNPNTTAPWPLVDSGG